MPEVVKNSPLAGQLSKGPRLLQVDGRECALAEIPFVEMWNLRGNADDASFPAAVLQHTGLHLPLKANGASIDPQRQLLWMGPDEWLLKISGGRGEPVAVALRAAFQGRHSAVIDVGHGNTTLSLQGPGAADLLSRGCPLDLHARAFPTGSLAQSHIAKTNATVLCLQAGTSYEITVRRSFANYLFHWLCAAGE
jgi:sarcosine oxidase subunit gamma